MSDPLASISRRKFGLVVWCATCLALLFVTLLYFADPEVRAEPGWFAFLMGGGAILLVATTGLMPFLGLSIRADAIEAGVPGAQFAIAGAFLGVTLSFAGSNIGEGETEWTTTFPAILSVSGFVFCWVLHELLSHASNAVIRERDLASGIRLGFLLVSTGLVFGTAAAGDWISENATIRDWLAGLKFAVILTLAAVIIQRALRLRNRAGQGRVVAACLPGLAYFAAALWFARAGNS